MTASEHIQADNGLNERLCVVVVTHNRPRLLENCINALMTQTVAPDGLLVVDNASDSDTASLLESYPNLNVLRLTSNRGGAGGFAAGLRWATEEQFGWAWIMDDDALPTKSALEGIIRAMQRVGNDVVALSSTLVDTGTTGKQDHLRQEAEFQIPRAHFVGLAIRLSAVSRAGLPREDFFIYSDDTEYCLRLRRGGYKILRAPHSFIRHADWYQSKRNIAVKLFGKRFVLYPTVAGWRKYYLARNRILSGYDHGALRFSVGVMQSVTLLFLTFILVPSDTGYAARGLIDGLRNRAGARVTPR